MPQTIIEYWEPLRFSSLFGFGNDDQIDRKYRPDTTAAYAPAILLDEVRYSDSLVVGRFAGRYVYNGNPYDPYRGRYPDTLFFSEVRFQAALHRLF